MSDIVGIAHFSIPVTDVKRSREFYVDVVGCKHLFSTPKGHMSFIDAGGVCLILVKQSEPVNPVLHNSEGVHHFLHDRARQVSGRDRPAQEAWRGADR